MDLGESKRKRQGQWRQSLLVTAWSLASLMACTGASGQQGTQSTPPAVESRPKRRTIEEIRNSFHNAKAAHAKVSPIIRHPRAAEALNPAILGQLKAQKLAASLGSGHPMDATGVSGGSQNPTGGSSTPAGGSGNPGGATGNNPTGASSNPPGTTGNNPAGGSSNPAGTAGNTATGGSTSLPSGGSTSSIKGPTPPRSMTRAVAAITPVANQSPPLSSSTSNAGSNLGRFSAPIRMKVCPPGTGPVVQQINGAERAVFTQDPNGNEYTMEGCRFGNSKGELHLEGGFKAGTISLIIESWSDTLIKAQVNPQLTGELDQNNVSLVVHAAGNGSPATVSGCKFYSLREQLNIQSFPSANVSISSVIATDGTPVKAVFSSPYKTVSWGGNASPPNLSPNLAGGVDRNYPNRFGPGMDVWDLGGLAPGFAPVSFQLAYWALENCAGSDFLSMTTMQNATIYNDGQWNAQWDPQNGNRILVSFAEQHCHLGNGFLGVGDDESNSSYALNITVVGPKGANPWP